MDFAEVIIRKLGLDPEALKAQFMGVVNDASTVKREVLAARAGFVNAAQAFDQRLARLEAAAARIEFALGTSPNETYLPLTNGEDHGTL